MDVISRGYRINYEVFEGGTPAIVLIHGMLQAAEDWIAYGYPELLAPSHRVVAIDLLGFGASDQPHDESAYGLDAMVEDLATVLDAAGVSEAVVWGYSLGCNTAEAFARQHPERTTALVLGGNLVGLSPTDRGNISQGGAAMLRDGGVRRLCEESMPFVDDRTRAVFEARNDAIAAALFSESMARPHAGDGAPLPDVTLNYAGSAEPWVAVAAAVAESEGVPFVEIADADHGRAFRSVDVVVPMVLSHLTAALD